MTSSSPHIRSRVWRGLGVAAETATTLGACALLVFATFMARTDAQQLFAASLTVAAALIASRAFASRRITLLLTVLSCTASFRYAAWRIQTVRSFFNAHTWRSHPVDHVVVLALLAAEAFYLLRLPLGYFQTLRPLGRRPVPLPADASLWPEVDVVIPTLNEPLSVLKQTALAAAYLDWPSDRLSVYVLDDGRREEVRTFCVEAGLAYLTRGTLFNAKAGNLNAALECLKAPYVAVFDADHVPTRSFLQMTMGAFLRDSKLGLVQTPQFTYSPDPFERNLDQFKTVPAEPDLFYGVIQNGNDLWNASYFCGSGAVLRRAALDDVGGFATGTLTEDAHTSIRLQRRGWKSAYINLPLAAGLAPERLRSYLQQHKRWATGMLQILRFENPLFSSGLKLGQRLCYFNASAHFLFALPRLLLLLAPVLMLVFGRTTWPGSWLGAAAYAIPHLALAYLAAERIQGRYRHAFWNGIYETVLAPWLLVPTASALFVRASGHFRVTPKRNIIARDHFDARIAWPYLLLFAANLIAMAAAALRFISLHAPQRLPAYLIAFHPTALSQGASCLNVLWAVCNLVLLSIAISVARESRQRRNSIRISLRVPASVLLQDGTVLDGATVDLSSGGALFVSRTEPRNVSSEPAMLRLPSLTGISTLPATIVSSSFDELRLRFDELSLRDEELLTTLLYSRADSWARSLAPTKVSLLQSLTHILRAGAQGLRKIGSASRSTRRDPRIIPLGIGAVLLLACSLGAGLGGTLSRAQRASMIAAKSTKGTTMSADFSLGALAGTGRLELDTAHPRAVLPFNVPGTEMVEKGQLRLNYQVFAATGFRGYLAVFLNGVELARLKPGVPDPQAGFQSAQIDLPGDLLVTRDMLSFGWMAAPHIPCEPATCVGVRAVIGGDSSVRMSVISLAAKAPTPVHGNRSTAETGTRRPPSTITALAGRLQLQCLRWASLMRSFGWVWWFSPLLSASASFVLALLLERALERQAQARLADPAIAS